MRLQVFGGEIVRRKRKCTGLHGENCASQRGKEAWGLGTYIVLTLLY
jgi:hypothetical protein